MRVIVVGAGTFGASLAWWLARAGAGSLKSLAIIVVIAVAAAAAMTVLAPVTDAIARTAVLETIGPRGFHRIFGNFVEDDPAHRDFGLENLREVPAD